MPIRRILMTRVGQCTPSRGDTVTKLGPDGFGGYTGIALGQTIYFSRVLSEEMDDPTLQLDGEYSEFTFAVFLDGELIYTDCPELDNRIGYLKLPMSVELREEPIKLSMPRNYAGKTLTIAQSTPEWAETETVRAYPAKVLLYCGYAYESTLITESFTVFASATALFILGAALLVSFICNRKLPLLAAALVAILWMCAVLTEASFYPYYFGYRLFNAVNICFDCSALLIMFLLTAKATRFKPALWAVTGTFGVSVATYAGLMLATPHADPTPLLMFLRGPAAEWIGAAALMGFLVLAALFTALWEAFRSELEQRMEKRLMKEQKELALASYENLRRQHEEVMMLRHDMARHFHALRGMTDEEKVAAYLSDLIGQNEKIRPVVSSGNEMLDIILGGKLSTAIDAGISVQIDKIEAPEKLPLSDADLCSLTMNIIDNAIDAAKAVPDAPFLKLNIHVKHSLLVIACENSADAEKLRTESKKETVPKHGLGLKIVRGIVDRYAGSTDTEWRADRFQVRILLPLDQLEK